jgi:hypothetical protein
MLFLRKQLRHGTILVIRDEEGQQWSCGLDSSGHAKTISAYLSPESLGTMDGYVREGGRTG